MDQDLKNVGGTEHLSENLLARRFLLRLKELADKGRFGKVKTSNKTYIKLLGILVRLMDMPNFPITLWGEEGSGKRTLSEELSTFLNLISRLDGSESKSARFIDCREVTANFTDNLFSENDSLVVFENIDKLSKDSQKKLLQFLSNRTELLSSGVNKVPRVVCTTTYSLSFKVLKKEFLKELFIILNPTLFCIPTLNERLEDVPMLFSEIMMDLTGVAGHTLEPALVDYLESQIWGLNIDQFRRRISLRLKFFQKHSRWTLAMWTSVFENKTPRIPGFQISKLTISPILMDDRRKLQSAFHRAGGNRKKAAGFLGIQKPNFYKLYSPKGSVNPRPSPQKGWGLSFRA